MELVRIKLNKLKNLKKIFPFKLGKNLKVKDYKFLNWIY